LVAHTVARTTIANILARHGINPAPERKTTWQQFLRTHWDVLGAADFFTVEVWSFTGLVRYHVFFVMELSTRNVEIVGIIHNPYGAWMEQIARNLTDCFDGFLFGKRYLILDRDPLFTKDFREILLTADVKTVRLPARSPNLNAFAERFVLSIKSECLNHMIFFSEDQLRRAIKAYVDHYSFERNHQGLGNRLIKSTELAANDDGLVSCHERLGGLLKYYYREAA
jgi:putative transposase